MVFNKFLLKVQAFHGITIKKNKKNVKNLKRAAQISFSRQKSWVFFKILFLHN